MNLKNKVIKVLNAEHGKKVIQWFKDQGVDTKSFNGSGVGRYYGIAGWGFTNSDKIPEGYTEIELPSELPKRGDRILVWNRNRNEPKERIFLAYVEDSTYPVITVSDGYQHETDFKNNKKVPTMSWEHYKLIEPVKEVELTLDEIATKFGINVLQLKIKK